ncbi:iron-containing alcohol dehydrogenase [Ruminococcus sp. AM27-11LB]|uniref:iron-containing alcohol dehydrogenase n=1 Tax=Mediterraneibacter TaxID=2316020 RepID=UPI000E4ADB41|nr:MULTISPECIES: iron-containing alcohol dehydrogenase [Mediterraneibacter]RGH90634.1 iron-containing alcohol dehydrogenase [Ruminococcus sp. AM27-27]RGH91947.1 iron-containing alcohol dehydrogenase [Ruminococcus sp. AM27-11LB]
MFEFHFHNPTEVYFGEGAVKNLPKAVEKYDRILFVYGGGSIRKSGIYDAVIEQLQEKEITELSGVMPNPRTEKVYEGIELCRKNQIELVLAVGGGSVSDCAKFIAAGAKLPEGEDFWQKYFLDQQWITEALPVGVISTMAATGSEMDEGGVITNWEQKLKLSGNGDACYPTFAILDPTYTYSVSKNQTVYGCVDILSHIFEIYFSKPDTPNVSDRLAEGLMRSVIENVDVVLKKPDDYTARANLMWCSTMALNGIIKCSKQQDWMSHQIEHALSAFYDIPHGAGLAIVHPVYMKYIYKNAPEKFAHYAQIIWGISGEGKTEEELALEGIERTRQYFREIGAPVTLKEVGIPEEAIPEIAAKTCIFPTSYSSLTRKDVENILHLCVKE